MSKQKEKERIVKYLKAWKRMKKKQLTKIKKLKYKSEHRNFDLWFTEGQIVQLEVIIDFIEKDFKNFNEIVLEEKE